MGLLVQGVKVYTTSTVLADREEMRSIFRCRVGDLNELCFPFDGFVFGIKVDQQKFPVVVGRFFDDFDPGDDSFTEHLIGHVEVPVDDNTFTTADTNRLAMGPVSLNLIFSETEGGDILHVGAFFGNVNQHTGKSAKLLKF